MSASSTTTSPNATRACTNPHAERLARVQRLMPSIPLLVNMDRFANGGPVHQQPEQDKGDAKATDQAMLRSLVGDDLPGNWQLLPPRLPLTPSPTSAVRDMQALSKLTHTALDTCDTEMQDQFPNKLTRRIMLGKGDADQDRVDVCFDLNGGLLTEEVDLICFRLEQFAVLCHNARKAASLGGKSRNFTASLPTVHQLAQFALLIGEQSETVGAMQKTYGKVGAQLTSNSNRLANLVRSLEETSRVHSCSAHCVATKQLQEAITETLLLSEHHKALVKLFADVFLEQNTQIASLQSVSVDLAVAKRHIATIDLAVCACAEALNDTAEHKNRKRDRARDELKAKRDKLQTELTKATEALAASQKLTSKQATELERQAALHAKSHADLSAEFDKKEAAWQAEKKKQDEDNLCAICMEEPRSHVWLSCGHLAMCSTCCQSALVLLCPICRAEPLVLANNTRAFTTRVLRA